MKQRRRIINVSKFCGLGFGGQEFELVFKDGTGMIIHLHLPQSMMEEIIRMAANDIKRYYFQKENRR